MQAAGLRLDVCDVGYVNLPADLDNTGFAIAGWTEEDYIDADAASVAVLEGVRAGHFKPAEGYSLPWDDWKRICGVDALSLTPDSQEVGA
jgi:hypothetical protein